MDRQHQPESLPRAVLVGVAILVFCTLVATLAARTTGVGTAFMAPDVEVDSLDLRFTDRADGAVEVHRVVNLRSEALLAVVAGGDGGFLRGVLRGLVRERRLNGIGAEAPFRLARRAGGALTLEDLATGRLIDLRAFGPTNIEAFARFLRATEDSLAAAQPLPLAAANDH